MLRELETPQKIFFYILFALTAVASALGVFAVYGFINVAKPKTLGVSYATVLNTTSGETPICEVNIFANKNNNGLELYEIKFNSYTDAEGSWVKGFGIQVPSNDWGATLVTNIDKDWHFQPLIYKTTETTKELVVYGDYSFYQSDNLGASSYKLVGNIGNNLYIDIEGAFYQIVLNSYEYETSKSTWYGGTKYEKHTAQYTWFELFRYIVDSVSKSSEAIDNTTYSIDLLDCAKYYHLLYQDDKGQYHPLPEVTDLKNYLQVKVNYHANGITDASQSMFGQVEYSPTWNYWDGTDVEDFWSVVTPMYITEDNISIVEAYGNQYISINSDFASYLKGLNNAEIYVNIDLDNINTTVSGILMDNFTFKTKEFNISSSTSQQFEILNPNTINTPVLNLGGV